MDNILVELLKLAKNILLPIIIIVATAGTIYAIVLGVNYSRAETSDKREEAKGRMVNAIVGIVATVFLLIAAQLVVTNAGAIVGLVRNTSGHDSVSISVTLPENEEVSYKDKNSVSFWLGKGATLPTGWASTDKGLKVDGAVKLSDTVWKVVLIKPKPKTDARLMNNFDVDKQQYDYNLRYDLVFIK